MKIDAKDRQILRGLAGKVSELAGLDVQQEKRQLWRQHNDLAATRPVIFCDPEGGWREIIPAEALECTGEWARNSEWILRRAIFWGESMGDDRVVEACFNTGYHAEDSGFGFDEAHTTSDNELGAYGFVPAIKSYDDVDKMQRPRITIDHEATERELALAHEVFDGLLTVRLQGFWWWSLGMTRDPIVMRGLEQYMLDMYDEAEGLHRLMAFLRDCNLAKLDFLEENNLLSLNNDGTYVGSGGFGYTNELPQADFDPTHVRAIDMWGFCESQETVGVSPELFEEFVFPYQVPIMERFGLNCYGCCEGLHTRWHLIKQMPRVRRVSVSPWADVEAMAEYLGDQYVFSLKPNPAVLAMADIDEEHIRAGLRRDLEITRPCRVEVIMKDCHTIGHNPQNVVRWCRIAREEADRVLGL